MSTQYNGNVANVNLPGQVAISSTTGNGVSPIEVTTSTPHNLTSNDFVDVAEVQGNTAANGSWLATVLDATHFLLNGSTGNGAYTTGGYVVSQGMGATFPQPSDGDDDAAASVNVAFECLADRTAVLGASTGAYKLVKFWSGGTDDAAENNNWFGGPFTFAAANAWETVGAIASPTTAATGILQPGDVIEVELTMTISWADGANLGQGMLVALGYGFSTAGNLPSGATKVPNSGVVVPAPVDNIGRSAVTLQAQLTVPSNAQVCELFLMAFTRSSSPTQISFYGVGDYSIKGRIWRLTGKAQ